MEHIISAAILVGDLICSMPRPARHGHIIRAAGVEHRNLVQPSDQGFLTSLGRFVSRKEARQLALDSEQTVESAILHKEELFSEDLW